MPRFMTKSRFKLGLECPTKLYYTKKEEIYADSGLTDPFLAALAEGGFQVGELAKSYFPEGHDIETLDYDESLEQTAALLRTDEATVFEAAVKHDNLFIRVDVLKKTATRLDLIEVKAKSIDPTEAAPFETRNGIDSRWKPYLYDVAFQKLVVADAFPHCEVRAYLMLVDKSVVCPTGGLHQKFAIVDEGNGRRGARQISDLTDEELANPILTRVNVDRHCQQLFDEAVETTEGPTRLEERIKWLAEHYERELMDREQRAADRRLRDAKFPVLKTLDNFDFAAQPSINEAAVRELMRGEYLSGRENVLIVGNPGTGKSHLATALGHAACMQGNRVRFFTVTGLVTQLLEHREERNLQRLHRQLERNRLLILDELGYVPFTKAGAELLFDVVSRAYERNSLIVTTNLPFEQWTEVMGSERLTGALLDRLTHRVHILEANGESYRLQDSKKRRKKTGK